MRKELSSGMFENLGTLLANEIDVIKSFDQVIAKSYRRTKLIAHSLKTNHVNQVQNEEDIFKFPSNKDWLPGNVNHTIQIFTEAIFKDIDIEKSTQKIEQNRT